MNRRDALKTTVACALTSMLPLSNAKAYHYAIVNDEKLSFSQLKIGDMAEIWNRDDKYCGMIRIVKNPYLNEQNIWTIVGDNVLDSSKLEPDFRAVIGNTDKLRAPWLV